MTHSLSKFLLPLMVTFLLLPSCENQLSTIPDSEAATQVNSKERIAQLLTAAYPTVSYSRFLELRTDNVGERERETEASRLNKAMYYWQPFQEDGADTPNEYWRECFRGIAQANKALELLASYPDKTDPELRALYAEAFLIRAYLHLMVANIWAPPYPGEEEAKRLPGIPYMEKPEKTSFPTYTTLSLAETYKRIERDLRFGLSWVTDDFYDKPRFHFNKRAAYALAARYFAYTAQWEEVVNYASYVVGTDVTKSILPYTLYQGLSRSELQNLYTAENNPSCLLLTHVESLWQNNYTTDRYGLNAKTVAQIFAREEGSVVRLEGFFNAVKHTHTGAAYWPKYGEYLSGEGLLNERRGHFTTQVLLTTDEALFHLVEAHAMLGKTDRAKGLLIDYARLKHADGKIISQSPITANDLENVRSSEKQKMQPFYRPLTLTQAGILYYASEFARQVFVHEGMRWFDLRRYNISVDRNAVGTPKNPQWVLQPEDERKTLPLPNHVNSQSLTPFIPET